MFEDVENIEWLSGKEYKQAIYFFQHPEEYDGDFLLFRDKLIEYASRPQGEAIKKHYAKIIKAKKQQNHHTEYKNNSPEFIAQGSFIILIRNYSVAEEKVNFPPS